MTNSSIVEGVSIIVEHLAATALNLNTWLTSAFRDDFLSQKLELTSNRFASIFVGFGHGSGSAVSPEYMELFTQLN